MRAFIAIEIPPAIKDSLAKLQDKLRLTLQKIGWVKPANLHLTLKFLGDISPEQLESIRLIIAETVKTALSFEIKLETLDVFPDLRRARIIWIGANLVPGELKQLVDQLETKLLEIGFAKEERPFQAHITLGRIRNTIIPAILEKGLDKVKKDCIDADLKFHARGITLFQSVLEPGGPTYSILEEADFPKS